MHPLLRIENLSVDFNHAAGHTVHAVKQANITVNRGETVAVVGESGSGKSVTALSVLQLLSGAARYSSGHIWWQEDDQPIDLLQADKVLLERLRGNRISMIFQEPMTSLNPVLTCGSQVMEAIIQHKKLSRAAAKAQTLALFEQVQLPSPTILFDKYPHQLSGGQKQRVMIAMAVSCEPALLICDEPTTALDVTVQKNILLLIKSLQQQHNMGVIFITHDLGVVAEIADKVVVMYRGEVIESSDKHTLFTYPQQPYTKALLACRPALYAKGQRLPMVSDFLAPASTPVLQMLPPTMPSQEHLLEVKAVNVWYPAVTTLLGKPIAFVKAVNDVSFHVYKGETLGLVGESGCGKTTLGRAILQLAPVTSGEVWFKGKDITQVTARELKALRKDMQIIFQDPYSSLNPRMTIGSAIAEVLQVHGLADTKQQQREAVVDLLEKVQLTAAHYHRYPHEFSGGQRQRIVIARALAVKPSFIICDESVSALDVSVQAQILNLLNDLKREFDFTAIFISHDLSVVRYISDRIIVMNKGIIEEMGTAEQVYSNPQSEYTKKLIDSVPKLTAY